MRPQRRLHGADDRPISVRLPFEDASRAQPATGRAAGAPHARVVYRSASSPPAIRDLLETSFGEVWVEGEISNCRVWNTGHVYFTLKDGGAQIKAVMFRSALRYLKFKPDDGLHVIARGRARRLRARRASIRSSASTSSRTASARCSSRSSS